MEALTSAQGPFLRPNIRPKEQDLSYDKESFKMTVRREETKELENQDFVNKYSDEMSCKVFFRDIRMKHGVICKKCGCNKYHWLEKKWQFQCSKCGFRTTLRSGTVMENSRLPFEIWFKIMYFMHTTKKDISACDLNRMVGHQRYATVWGIMHKLRSLMAKKSELHEINCESDIEESINELFTSYEMAME